MATIRDSKFRHIVGSLAKREEWYENLNVASNVSDSNMMSASSKFFAYVDSSGGGSTLSVLPYTSVGKNHIPITASSYQLPLVRGHAGQIVDVEFSPFDPCTVATASADSTVKIWSVPAEGMTGDVTTPVASLLGLTSGARSVRFNGSAEGVVAISSTNEVKVFATSGAEPRELYSAAADVHTDAVQDIQWAHDGSLLASTCRDKKLRLLDVRANSVAGEVVAHQGPASKSIRALWCEDVIVTTGFSVNRDREFAIWDPRAMDSPLARTRIDSSTGVVMPFYDPDTKLLYLAGKGDSSLRYYEMVSAAPHVHPINILNAGEVTMGMAMVPKRNLNLMGTEVARLLKLTRSSVEPLSVDVPRKSKRLFQDDLYPPSATEEPALSLDQWLAGESAPPRLAPIDPPSNTGRAAAAAAAAAAADEGDEEKSAATGAEGAGLERRGSARRKSSLKTAAMLAARGGGSFRGSAGDRSSVGSSRSLNSDPLSKYKYIFGTEAAKERTYFNLRPNTSSQDSPLIAVNDRWWAIPWAGAGGGPVCVGALDNLGKVEPNVALINGHRGAVLDLAFSPFHAAPEPSLLATASDDSYIKLWNIPEAGVTENLTAEDARGVLSGHSLAARTIDFHPTAENVLMSTSADLTVRLWDVNQCSEMLCCRDVHPETIMSAAFNLTGDSIVTTCRDKNMRLFDPRSNEVIASVQAHEGSKGSRARFVGGQGTGNRQSTSRSSSVASASEDDGGALAREFILSVGFGRFSERQFALWDPRNMVEPLSMTKIDTSGGMLFPFYEEGSGVVMLAGKGDTTIRIYALNLAADVPVVSKCSDFTSGSQPLAGMAMLPQTLCDIANVEFARILRLTPVAIEPVSFFVPRSQKLKSYFQDDIFGEVRTSSASITASDWMSGKTAHPRRVSIRPEGMTPLSEKPEEVRTGPSKADLMRQRMHAEQKEEQKKEDVFNRMQNLAVQRSKYHPNESMGAAKGVDAMRVVDGDSSDGGWSD